jgi:hypothetical protein
MSAKRENESGGGATHDDCLRYLSEDCIENHFRSSKCQDSIAESTMRHLSLGIRPLPVPSDCFKPQREDATCNYCNTPESTDTKLMKWGKCHFATYCSRDCQLGHWKESHKSVCKHLSAEKDEQAKRIV